MKSIQSKQQNNKTYYNLEEFLTSKLSSHSKLNLYLNEKQANQQGNEVLKQNLESAFSKCLNLLSLTIQITYNNITQLGAQVLGNHLIDVKKLETLKIYLSFNKIGELGIKNLSQNFLHYKNLLQLTLFATFNNIGGSGASYLGFEIGFCQKLKKLELDLSNNNIDIQGVNGLNSGLMRCSSLSSITLYLSSNILIQRGNQQLSFDVQNQKNLVNYELFLSKTQIESSFITNFCNNLLKAVKLQTLTLNFEENSIPDYYKQKLENTVNKMRKLVKKKLT
ncbi:hypothetical protein ABPG74_019798 [Tetrahymena malaccensis]